MLAGVARLGLSRRGQWCGAMFKQTEEQAFCYYFYSLNPMSHLPNASETSPIQAPVR